MGDDSASGKLIAHGKLRPLYKDRLSSLYEGTVTGLVFDVPKSHWKLLICIQATRRPITIGHCNKEPGVWTLESHTTIGSKSEIRNPKSENGNLKKRKRFAIVHFPPFVLGSDF